jgi:ATP-dependent Lhr-like helicase
MVPEPADPPGGELHEVLRRHLLERGASFWPDLVAAAQAAGGDYADQAVLGALWDLVWAGEVTNDSFTPVRALLSGAAPRRPGSRRSVRAGRRPPLRSLSRLGPPAGTGRWAPVEPLRRPAVEPTEAAAVRALQLLERYGVLTREMALAEGAEGGFAGVYPVLKEMEDRGQVRRGYFVAGLGAAQFALPGAVDRLRDERQHGAGSTPEPPLVLAACDPAQPYGAALAWPDTGGRPSRSSGAHVVLRDGRPLAFVERGGRSLALFARAASDPSWVEALSGLVRSGQLRSLEIQRVDGRPVAERPEISELLLAGGFRAGYRGPILRR